MSKVYKPINQKYIHSSCISFPIGTVFITVVNTNPSNFLVGTWESFGAGRCLVGVDSSDSDFNTVEKTGGSKYLQKHDHYSMQIDDNKVAWGGSGNELNLMPLGMPWTGNFNQGSKIITSKAGTGNSENLQPYITVYFWKRTK